MIFKVVEKWGTSTSIYADTLDEALKEANKRNLQVAYIEVDGRVVYGVKN